MIPSYSDQHSGPITDLQNFPGFLLRRGQQAHVAAWTKRVSTKVTSVQFGLMKALNDSPGLSQKDLGDILDLDRSTIAEIVGRLERRGFVTRERDDDDLRRNQVWLTGPGASEVERLEPRVYEANIDLLGGLTTSDQRELRRILIALVDSACLKKDSNGFSAKASVSTPTQR